MSDWSIFDLYRRLLALVVGTYATIRFISFVWSWRLAFDPADRHEALLRKYLVTLLIRGRLRRFWLDGVQIIVLTVVLVYLLSLHGV